MNAKKVVVILIACLVVAANILLFSDHLSSIFRSVLFSKLGAGNLFSGNNTASSGGKVSIIKAGDSDSKIATVTLDGGLDSFMKQDYITRSLNDIMKTPEVKGVIVRIDSPRSGIYESVEISDIVKSFKGSKNVPVYAVIGSGTSAGGYCVAIACDKVYAKEGSVINYTKLFEKSETELGTTDRALSIEGRNSLRSILENAYEKFISTLVESKGIDETQAKTLTDGRIYDASQARDNQLVDEVGSFDDAVNAMKSQLGLSNPEIISYDSYNVSKSIFSFEYSMLNDTTTHIGPMYLWRYAV